MQMEKNPPPPPPYQGGEEETPLPLWKRHQLSPGWLGGE